MREKCSNGQHTCLHLYNFYLETKVRPFPPKITHSAAEEHTYEVSHQIFSLNCRQSNKSCNKTFCFFIEYVHNARNCSEKNNNSNNNISNNNDNHKQHKLQQHNPKTTTSPPVEEVLSNLRPEHFPKLIV